jgi:hypothetical protein
MSSSCTLVVPFEVMAMTTSQVDRAVKALEVKAYMPRSGVPDRKPRKSGTPTKFASWHIATSISRCRSLPLLNLTNNTKPALNNPIPQDAMGGKSATKSQYFDKLKGLLEEYRSIFIVGVDNVSSQQMHEIRHAMRSKGVILMGKNTMVSGISLQRARVHNG